MPKKPAKEVLAGQAAPLALVIAAARREPVPSTIAEHYGAAENQSPGEIWAQTPLGGDWTAAARVAPDARGLPVIAELRIFPREASPAPHFPGRWNAELFGVNARGVPRGGLPITVLRRVRLSGFRQFARDTLRLAVRARASNGDADILTRLCSQLAGAGFRMDFKTDSTSMNSASGVAVARRGRPSLPAREYAQLAKEYIELLDTGRPVQRLAERRNLEPRVIRNRIARARALGYLQPADGPGRAGGRITPRAETLLACAAQESPSRQRSNQSRGGRR